MGASICFIRGKSFIHFFKIIAKLSRDSHSAPNFQQKSEFRLLVWSGKSLIFFCKSLNLEYFQHQK